MKLVNFLNDLFKEDGFRLIDANKREYLIGKPFKKDPLILELLDSSMHYKLLLLPELYLGEGYMDGKIKIHNGTIKQFHRNLIPPSVTMDRIYGSIQPTFPSSRR